MSAELGAELQAIQDSGVNVKTVRQALQELTPQI